LGAALGLVPSALSLIVLAAHFLRRGAVLPTSVCLALLALLWVRRPWAARTLQATLVLATIEWGRTLAGLVSARRAAGEPWERMAAILGAVAVMALVAALALELPTLRQRFGRPARRA